jgi:hypothetical protein
MRTLLLMLLAFSAGCCYVSGAADRMAAEHIRAAHATECNTHDCWE